MEQKIVFADSFFESLDDMGMTEEEKQELIDEIAKKIEDGSIHEESEPLSEEEAEELGLEGDFIDPKDRTIN